MFDQDNSYRPFFFIFKGGFIKKEILQNMMLGDETRTKNERRLSRAHEIPMCPFCDGKVYYIEWVTHKIFQMGCEKCGARWRSGIKSSSLRETFVELIKQGADGKGKELLNQKFSVDFWRNSIRKRIPI
jgi:ribosomal protein L37AE/L43A